MGMRDWFRKALRGSPEIVESLAARQVTGYPPIGGTNLTRQQINRAYETMQNAAYAWMYQYQPAVRSVVDYIARNATQLGPPKLYERTGVNSREERPNHGAAITLQEPHEGVTPGGMFMLNILSDFLVYDNAYGLKIRPRPGAEPMVVLSLPPHCVGIVGDKRFSPEGYNVYRADGSYFTVDPGDMIHWHGYNPDDPRLGFSRLETLREVLAEEAALQTANVELAKSGLGAPGHIERPLEAPEWSEEAQQRFEEDWANRMKMRERRTPVLEEGMTFKEAAMSPKDAEVMKSRQFSREEVAGEYGMYHVPPRTDEELQLFYSEVLSPLLDQYAWFLNTQLLVVEYGEHDMYFETSLDEKLIGDNRIKTMVSATGGPVMTRNEARRRLNLEPKPGGDDLIVPLNVIVGGKPSPRDMPIQDPNEPSQDGDFREAGLPPGTPPWLSRLAPWMDENRIREEVKRVVREEGEWYRDADVVPDDDKSGEASQSVVKAEENGDKDTPRKEVVLARRAAQIRRRDEYQEEILELLTRNFDRLDRAAKSDGKSVNWTQWKNRLQKELLTLATQIIKREGGIQSVRFGAHDIDMAQTTNWILKMSKERANDITTALKEALTTNDRVTVISEAKDTAGPRAARTLASGFASFAVLEAANQAPNAERRTKTWIVTSENSAHPEMDGETVELGKKFSNGRKAPPAEHPGCQCLVEVN